MASSNDGIATLLLAIGAIIVIYLIVVYIILPTLALFMAGGALIGGGNAVYNYFIAFRKNVRAEKVVPV